MTTFQQHLISRRTIYKFTDEDVPADIINQALEAAAAAPCHKHTHPWKFYSIGQKARISLLPDVKRLAEIKSKKKGSQRLEEDLQRAVEKILNVPVLFAITSKRNPSDLFREKEDYAATVCALHNMVLSFWANGVGSMWSTGSITREEKTYQNLGIDPEKEEIIGFLKAGYPQSIPTVRKPHFNEVTTNLH
ncbi:MAG: nitroreductase [Euryarchaeota archaeon]|nr:nitroreductase [Euryarchaeota archaeon]